MVIHTNDPYSSYTTNGLGTLDFWLAQNGRQTTAPATDAVTPNACQTISAARSGPRWSCARTTKGTPGRSRPAFPCSSTSTVCFDANVAVWDFFTSLP